jgi:hypothetical protein
VAIAVAECCEVRGPVAEQAGLGFGGLLRLLRGVRCANASRSAACRSCSAVSACSSGMVSASSTGQVACDSLAARSARQHSRRVVVASQLAVAAGVADLVELGARHGCIVPEQC